jgi:hypothetical protein
MNDATGARCRSDGLATADQVATYLHTTPGRLAQM